MLRRRPLFAGGRLQLVRRHGKRLALVVAAGASLGGGTVLAGARLDQQNPFTTDTARFGQGIQMTAMSGQTFTAGATGSLDRVAVYLDPIQEEPLQPAAIFLDVYPTDGAGLPRTDGAPIGSGRAPTPDPAQGPEFVTIALSHPAAVKAGKVYAIVLHSDVEIEFSLSWEGSAGPNLYPGGGEALRFDANSPWKVFPQDDYFFKTFVTPSRRRGHK
jgi:hypothetical protein